LEWKVNRFSFGSIEAVVEAAYYFYRLVKVGRYNYEE